MNRRTFLYGTAATAAAVHLSARAEGPSQLQPTISLGTAEHPLVVPADFVGLSYESAQLANPAFFSAQNKELISLFRELSPQGNLRLGGGASEFTTFSDNDPTGPPPFEVFGPDTSKTVKEGTVTTALAIRNLRAFLDTTGWNCLYGLNLGRGTVENAVREATAVHKILGPRLVAFQIGNEPDSFRNRYRPATYGPADFIIEWLRFHDAILQAVPGARFAGPDISNKLAYLAAFAEEAPKHPDIVLLTGHYYAMGPAGNPGATLDNLLDPDPKLTTMKLRDLHLIQEARERAHLPFRMSEGNSCWNGGQTGVSDVFASALWCADYMLTCMQRGWAGVNLHGGGANGVYAPIVGVPSTGFHRRPEFFGMLFAQRYACAHVLPCTIDNAAPRVSAYVFVREGKHELVIINKTSEPVTCGLPSGMASPLLTLHAPSIDAKEGVAISNARRRLWLSVTAPAYTATVYDWKMSTSQR